MVSVASRTIRKRKAADMSAAYRAGMQARTYAPSLRGRRTGAVSTELKFWDGTLADTTTFGITNSSLNLIPQGVTESSRVGRKCVVKSIRLKGKFILSNTTTLGNAYDWMRLIIYVDKQCNGTAATATDILETDALQSFRNLSNTGRFKILHDKSYVLNPTAGAYTGAATTNLIMTKQFSINKRVNIPLEFSSTTGALSELRSNNIGVLVVANNGTVSYIGYNWRLLYSDS